jgi:predicted N-acetyltransferase YhbS
MPLTPELVTFVAQSAAQGVVVRGVAPPDYSAMAALHDIAFGPGALTRTAYRVREGQPWHGPYCRVALDHNRIIAFVRFAAITIGGKGPALMLGPLAVASAHANRGHARRLIAEGLQAAEAADIELVVLVGDAAYYGRLGFVPVPRGQITMPGPVDPTRLLAYELRPAALGRVAGPIAGVQA